MTLDAADLLYDVKPDEARKKMNDANTKIRGSLESIRRAVRVLDEENKPLSAQDLKSEFAITVDEFAMDTSLQIHENYNDIHDEVSIPYDHVIFLTGVLQEMLTNGVKHGNATEFLVVLVGDSAHIRLEVSDNGKSDFSNANSNVKIENGFGLKKIISYTEKCGGKCRFCNENGFQSVVELPIIL
jgi:signal transduction histidine kinase